MANLILGDALAHQALQLGDGPHAPSQRANGVVIERVLVDNFFRAVERHLEGKNSRRALPRMSCFTAFVSKLNRVSCHLGRQLMRNLLIFVALFFSALRGIGLGGRGSKISELPDGTLSGKVYSNDALGMRYEIPSGWIATADPKGPVSLDSRKPDGPVNQCSKVVLALHAPERG